MDSRHPDVGKQAHARSHDAGRERRLLCYADVTRPGTGNDDATPRAIGAREHLPERHSLDGMLATIGEEQPRALEPACVRNVPLHDPRSVRTHARRHDDAVTLQ